MTTQTKQYRNVSKMKVAGKMAKKLAVGAMKVAASPIVGHLSYDRKCDFYGEDKNRYVESKTHPMTYYSGKIARLCTPVVSALAGATTGYAIMEKMNQMDFNGELYVIPVFAAAAGLGIGLILNTREFFSDESDSTLLGKIMEFGIGSGKGLKRSVQNMYLSSIRETRNDERRKISRFEKLKSELEEITKFSNDEYLKYSTKPESENDREKLREVA